MNVNESIHKNGYIKRGYIKMITATKYVEEIYDLGGKPFHIKSYNGITSNPVFLSKEFY